MRNETEHSAGLWAPAADARALTLGPKWAALSHTIISFSFDFEMYFDTIKMIPFQTHKMPGKNSKNKTKPCILHSKTKGQHAV